MSARQLRFLLVVCGLDAMLSMPATCHAGCGLCNIFGGGGSPGVVAQTTTYAPPYYAAYAAEYPAPAYAAPVGGCSSCAAPAAGCSSCGAQVVQYAPYVSFRPTILRPVTTYYAPTATCNSCAAPVAAYYPPAPCSTCAAPVTSYYAGPACSTCAAPVTAFRPVGLFTEQVRLIPYSTYRMAYMPVSYVGYAPVCTSCASPCGSSCGSPCASSCGSCNTCASAGVPVTATYESPACSATQPQIGGTYVAPSTPTQPSAAPSTAAPSTDYGQPKTFQDQRPAEETKPSLPSNNATSPDSKPSVDQKLDSAPQPETRLNSSPGPQLGAPDDRTTSSPVRQAMYLVNRPSRPVEPATEPSNSGWRQSHD